MQVTLTEDGEHVQVSGQIEEIIRFWSIWQEHVWPKWKLSPHRGPVLKQLSKAIVTWVCSGTGVFSTTDICGDAVRFACLKCDVKSPI